MKSVRALATFLVYLQLWATSQVVPANGQLSRTSPPPGSVVCPGARVEYTCHTGKSGRSSILTWSIDGVVLVEFVGILSDLHPGITSNIPGGVVTLTDVNLTSGLTSTLVFYSAGENNVTNRTVIGCTGTGITDMSTTLNIISTEVTNVTAPLPSGLTLSVVQVEVANPEASMCTYCVDIPGTSIINYCMQSRTISLPQNLNLCQDTFTVIAFDMSNTSVASTLAVGDPNGLDSVSNIHSSSSSLMWSPPANRPEDCVTSYEISWNGGNFSYHVSDENMLSVDFFDLEAIGLPKCETVNITISPILPALGVLRDKSGSFKRQGLDDIENIIEEPCFNDNGSLNISVRWNPFDDSIQGGATCNCTFGTETVNCDSGLSSCVLTVNNGSELFERMFSYSININYRDCPTLSDTGTITAPTIITDVPLVNISGSSVTVSLELNRTVVPDNIMPMINLTSADLAGSNSSYQYFPEHLIVNFTGLNPSTEYKYLITIEPNRPPVCGVFVTGMKYSSSQFISPGEIGGIVTGCAALTVAAGGTAATAAAVHVHNKKKKKKTSSSDEETVELKKPRESSPAVSPSEQAPTYADPNVIKHETGPETGELYAVAAKPSKPEEEEE